MSKSVLRRILMGTLLLAVLVEGTLLSLNGGHIAYAAASNWPMLGYNLEGTRYNPNEIKLSTGNVHNLVQKWSFATFALGVVGSSPAVVNGIVYIGATTHDFATGEVDALSAKTGAVIWKLTTAMSIDASPTVANGVVYIGTEDGTFYALNAATGAVIWQTVLGSGSDPIHSSALVANGLVYVGSMDHHLYALNASTGAVLWKYDAGDVIGSSPALYNGIVYIVSNVNNDTLFALRAKSGKLLWSFPIPGAGNNYSSPAVSNGIVYVWGLCGCANGTVYALNAATGSVDWFWNTSWLAGDFAIANGTLYVQAAKNLNALDASTGALLWASASDWNDSGPAVANGVVYFDGTGGGTLYAANATTGALLWSSPLPNSISDSPAVANGFVYLGDWDGSVYAFGLK